MEQDSQEIKKCLHWPGTIELEATQGMVQNSGDYDKKYEPINYHELVGDLQERVRGVERKLDYQSFSPK